MLGCSKKKVQFIVRHKLFVCHQSFLRLPLPDLVFKFTNLPWNLTFSIKIKLWHTLNSNRGYAKKKTRPASYFCQYLELKWMNVQLFNCREYKTQFAATDHNCIITFNKEDNFSNFLQVILQVLALKKKKLFFTETTCLYKSTSK